MLATGAIMLGADDDRLTDVIAYARVWLDTPPHISDEALTLRRYMIATAFEDARDVVERDPNTALLLLGEAVPEALAYSFLAAGRNVPRHKDMLLVLARVNPALAAAVAQFVGEPNSTARYAAALVIADLTVHARGFFAWESARRRRVAQRRDRPPVTAINPCASADPEIHPDHAPRPSARYGHQSFRERGSRNPPRSRTATVSAADFAVPTGWSFVTPGKLPVARFPFVSCAR